MLTKAGLCHLQRQARPEGGVFEHHHEIGTSPDLALLLPVANGRRRRRPPHMSNRPDPRPKLGGKRGALSKIGSMEQLQAALWEIIAKLKSELTEQGTLSPRFRASMWGCTRRQI
jgi:hypothetical protein